MLKLLKINEVADIPIPQYYCESEEEIEQIPEEVPVSSTVLLLTDTGLTVKMKHSSGKWIEI